VCIAQNRDTSRVAHSQSCFSHPLHPFLHRPFIFPSSLSTNLLRSAGDLPGAIGVNNNLGAGEQTLAQLLLGAAIVEATLPLGSPPPLLDQSVAGLAEVAHLVVLHALEPVAEAGADEAVDGVGEEALAVEEGAHLNSELP
jgi:hypothetical protein